VFKKSKCKSKKRPFNDEAVNSAAEHYEDGGILGGTYNEAYY
jgi:hypothetical protein